MEKKKKEKSDMALFTEIKGQRKNYDKETAKAEMYLPCLESHSTYE